MKQAVLLQISMTNLTISMNKPFNPIVGETYQGFIDGCPVSAQQLSHHPPITYNHFKGRGYNIYGCMEPKISLGLNFLSIGLQAGLWLTIGSDLIGKILENRPICDNSDPTAQSECRKKPMVRQIKVDLGRLNSCTLFHAGSCLAIQGEIVAASSRLRILLCKIGRQLSKTRVTGNQRRGIYEISETKR